MSVNQREWDPAEEGPKVTVEFILPQHAEELEDFIKISSIKNLLWTLQSDLRNCVKHGAAFDGMEMDSSKIDLAEKIKHWIHEEATNRGIKLD